MNQYFFALGTNHSLCKIDIVNTLLKKGVDFEITEASEEILIISTEIELDTKSLINELGSAAKIGEIIGKPGDRNFSEKCPTGRLGEKNLEENIREIIKGKKFGLSVYQAGGKYRDINAVFEKTKKLKKIREKGRVLSTVAVDKNKLLDKGLELVICVGSKGIYLGKTLAIQDYESYSFRDYSRPVRDARSGMIPPKLAKMMISLAGKDKENVFLDPFCGSGTVLQELILLGYKNIIGVDIEDRAIADSQKNLNWLFENYKLKKEDFKIDVFKSDARVLSEKMPKILVDAVVTEPFLGSSEVKYLSLNQIEEEIQKLEDLYLTVFKEFKKILKNSGRVVIIFPVFRYKNQFFQLQILESLKKMGFKQADFIGKKIEGEELLKLQITKRGSVVYFRPGQSVSREIFIFFKESPCLSKVTPYKKRT